MAIRKQTIKKQANALVARALQPGDQIISGVYSMAGPNPMYSFALGVLVAAAASAVASVANTAIFVIIIILAFVPFYAADHYYVAVTRQQVVFVKMNVFTNRPKEISSTAPLQSVGGISDYRPSALWWSSFRYTVPAAPPLRLNVHRAWRQELDALVGAFGVPVR